MAPDSPGGHNQLGLALAKMGRMNEAADQLQIAISLRPASVEYRFNLGYVMAVRGDSVGAVATFQRAVELSGVKDWRCLAALADAYDKAGRPAEAIQSAHEALDLVRKEHNEQLEKNLRSDLERYERNSVKPLSQ
jgi:Flp pilus assembly protein TadD